MNKKIGESDKSGQRKEKKAARRPEPSPESHERKSPTPKDESQGQKRLAGDFVTEKRDGRIGGGEERQAGGKGYGGKDGRKRPDGGNAAPTPPIPTWMEAVSEGPGILARPGSRRGHRPGRSTRAPPQSLPIESQKASLSHQDQRAPRLRGRRRMSKNIDLTEAGVSPSVVRNTVDF